MQRCEVHILKQTKKESWHWASLSSELSQQWKQGSIDSIALWYSKNFLKFHSIISDSSLDLISSS